MSHTDGFGRSSPGLTINCSELVEIVTDYLEGVLDEATNNEIEAHLALCSPCRVYLDQMRATIEVVGHVPVHSLSDQAKADLVVAFRGYRRPGPVATY